MVPRHVHGHAGFVMEGTGTTSVSDLKQRLVTTCTPHGIPEWLISFRIHAIYTETVMIRIIIFDHGHIPAAKLTATIVLAEVGLHLVLNNKYIEPTTPMYDKPKAGQRITLDLRSRPQLEGGSDHSLRSDYLWLGVSSRSFPRGRVILLPADRFRLAIKEMAPGSQTWVLSHGRLAVTSALLLLIAAAVVSNAQLSENFYDATCPQAASIIKAKVDEIVDADRGLAAALMRLHFHDCFVRGCDGSVLLNSTDDMLAEKDALLNKGSLRGFEQIDEIKMALECACPGIVSCADILAIVARDATVKVGGWSWPVFLGRVDGAASIADEVNGSLPERRDNFTQLVSTFAKVGLDAKDMVILSGGHSIGQVHCGSFFERLYNYQGLNITDPSIDPEFADLLKAQCPQTQPFGFMALDASNGTFDSTYYLDLLTNKGLLESDVALLTDPLGVEYAIKAVYDPQSFLFEFGMAMIKMGNIPGTAPYGWRKHCAFVQ